MEILKIVVNDANEVVIESETDMSYGEALGLCIDGLEALLSHGVSNLKHREGAVSELHDYMTYSLTSILGRVFPDDEEFTLTDAAIYKAQNELLEQSMNEGVPIAELIAGYNKKANQYLEKVKKNS